MQKITTRATFKAVADSAPSTTSIGASAITQLPSQRASLNLHRIANRAATAVMDGMDPALRHRLAALVAGAMAIVLGWQLASGEHIWAFLGLAAISVLGLEWLGGARPEALFLGFNLVGYILGNRGFAQISPLGNAPLFFGELVLGFGLALTLVRGAIGRQLPWRSDWLNRAVLLWLGIGTIRIWHDFRVFGAPALRDFATIYYAAYFFVAQAAMEHGRSAKWLKGCMIFATTLLPLVSLLYNLFPEFFLTRLVLRGVPIIYQKNDLAASFLFAGALFLTSLPRQSIWVRFSSIFSLGSGLAWLSRAAMVALAVVGAAWSWARQTRLLRRLGVTVLIGLVLVLAEAAVRHEEFTETTAYSLYEHIASLTDMSGTRVYKNADAADSGDNNRFRIVWWKTIINDTWRENPWLGLGFGRDLAEDFIVTYGLWGDDSFNVRSPHSIFFTLFGRLGFAGLLALLVLSGAMVGAILEVTRQVRIGRRYFPRADLMALGWFSVAGIVFISAWFGVVLEGPMGAVVFWSALGIGNAERRRISRELENRENDPREAPEPERLENSNVVQRS